MTTRPHDDKPCNCAITRATRHGTTSRHSQLIRACKGSNQLFRPSLKTTNESRSRPRRDDALPAIGRLPILLFVVDLDAQCPHLGADHVRTAEVPRLPARLAGLHEARHLALRRFAASTLLGDLHCLPCIGRHVDRRERRLRRGFRRLTATMLRNFGQDREDARCDGRIAHRELQELRCQVGASASAGHWRLVGEAATPGPRHAPVDLVERWDSSASAIVALPLKVPVEQQHAALLELVADDVGHGKVLLQARPLPLDHERRNLNV
mmetsp:Transcript_83390/g.232564  ORF Transcript_83390/g.232564 Transcript_83390/m.232564 type:complete len:266 (+) Transcript_83390:83-880(+)